MAKKDEISRIEAALQKRFGKTSAQRLGANRNAAAQITEVIPTGVAPLDYYALGIGGLPGGRMSELYGAEGSGKTSLLYLCLAAVQRLGGVAVMADTEFGFDEERAALFGVNLDDLLILQPANIAMCLDAIRMTLDMHDPVKQGPILVGWDSLATSKTAASKAADAGNYKVGDVPRIMSEELPKLAEMLAAKRGHLMVLNQTRDNIGVMFGDKKITPGGNALKFHASWRAQILGGKAIKDANGQHTGKVVTLLVMKTRMTPPFRKLRLRLDYATGWNNEWSVLEHAKTMKVMAARGKKGAPTKGPKALAAAMKALGWDQGAGDTTSSTPGLTVLTPADGNGGTVKTDEEE